MSKKQAKSTGSRGGAGLTPLGDRVLIKETPKEDKKTAGGFIIPETVKTDKGAKRGTIVAVGSGRYEDGKLVPLSVKEGDEVLFDWGDEITIDGEEYHLVKESEVYAVVRS